MTKGVGKTHSEAGDGPAGYLVPPFAGFIRSQVLARTGGAPAPRESTRGWPLIRSPARYQREERVHGESVAKIMRAWEVAGRGPDAGPPEECTHGAAEPIAAVAASARTVMPEERAVRRGWQSPLAANLDQMLDLAGGIRRHRITGRGDDQVVDSARAPERRLVPAGRVPRSAGGRSTMRSRR